MSNNIIFVTQVGSIIVFVSSLFILYRLLVQQKDATIELLKEKNDWLKDQLSAAQESNPDVLLENLEKRRLAMEEELNRLNQDSKNNTVLIAEKEKQLETLSEQIEDLEARIDECPHCGAELVMLSGGGYHDYENKSYACGHLVGEHNHPCPFDPNFPTLKEYELEMKYDERRETWYCFPKPKTKMANMLELDNRWGKTEQEARDRVIAEYNFYARKAQR